MRSRSRCQAVSCAAEVNPLPLTPASASAYGKSSVPAAVVPASSSSRRRVKSCMSLSLRQRTNYRTDSYSLLCREGSRQPGAYLLVDRRVVQQVEVGEPLEVAAVVDLE